MTDLGIPIIELDLASEKSSQAAINRIQNETGRLDFLFNNADVLFPSPAIDVAVEKAQECFDINLFGVINITNAAIELLKQSKGTIVNTGSVLAFTPYPYSSVYSASKAALEQYTNILRLELMPFEVKVVLLCLTPLDTDVHEKISITSRSSYHAIESDIVALSQTTEKNQQISSRQIVKSIMPQVLVENPKRIIWGGKATWYYWILRLVPRWIIELIFFYKFRLAKLAAILKRGSTGTVRSKNHPSA